MAKFWEEWMGDGKGEKEAKTKGKTPESKERPKAESTLRIVEQLNVKVADYRSRQAAGEILDGDIIFNESNTANRLYEHAVFFSRSFDWSALVFSSLSGSRGDVEFARSRARAALQEIDRLFPHLDTVPEFDIDAIPGFRGGHTFRENIEKMYDGVVRDVHDLRKRRQESVDFSERLVSKLVRGHKESILVDQSFYDAIATDIESGAITNWKELSALLKKITEDLEESSSFLHRLYQTSPSERARRAWEFFGGDPDFEQKGEQRERNPDGEGAVDLYAVLGIPHNASQAEIKKAFLLLARQTHPDIGKERGGDAEKFKRVKAAYDILSEPSKRAQYDRARR